MKFLLKILFAIILILIIVGFIMENYTAIDGKIYIGSGVTLFAFVFMPFFIYYRYKNRIEDYVDKRMEQPEIRDKR